MRTAKSIYKIYIVCAVLLCGNAALHRNAVYADTLHSAAEKEDINALSALEFELKTTLYGRGAQFQALRAVLGGFETIEQIIYLMRVPESIAERLRANFLAVPIAGSELEISDEPEDTGDLPEFNLALLSAAELEDLPFITPSLAGRIARASRRGELTERWKLVTVNGVTPEIYAAIRRYFTVREPVRQSKNSLRHEIGFSAAAGSWRLRNTLRAETGERTSFALRASHDNIGDMFSPRGWYASGGALPGLARRLGMHAVFGGDRFSFLLGNFRARTPLGLAAGRGGFGGETGAHAGAKNAALLPQLSDSARDVFTGAAFTFALPGFSVQTFVSARSYFADPEKLQGNIYQGTLRSLIYKQENLRESDSETINEYILGTLARLDLRKVSLSAACFLPFYSHAFASDEGASSMSGDRRMHGTLSFSWNEEGLNFFGECAFAGDAGYGGSGVASARALELGLRGKRARLRYSLRYQESTQILPGLHDGLAGLARAGRSVELQNEWFIFDSLRWQYAVNVYPESEAQSTAKSRFDTTLRWKTSGLFELLLSARLARENNERVSAQYRCTFIWPAGRLFSLKADCGTRLEKGRGGWLTSALLLPIAGVRCTLAYGAWQADPKLHLWPSFPTLASAGENTLTSYTGKGRMVLLKGEVPVIKEKLHTAFKASFKDWLEAGEPLPLRELSFAVSLRYSL